MSDRDVTALPSFADPSSVGHSAETRALLLGATCPICDAAMRRRFETHGYWIRECERCRHQCAEMEVPSDHVTHRFDDDYFKGGGAGYPDYLAEADLQRARGRYYHDLIAQRCPPGRVLDVGAAAGFLLESYLDAGWSGAAIEPNASMADAARSRLGIEVFEGALEDYNAESPFDLVMIMQVLPHFVDLRRSLAAAAAATASGGYWLIEAWNRRSWTARVFGRHWHEYSPPTALHSFHPDGLRELAGQFGFREVARGRPRRSISGAHAKSLLRYKLEEGGAGPWATTMLGVIPDSLSIPYPGDDLFWVLFQRQQA